MSKASFAVTVVVNEAPAVCGVPAVTDSVEAAAGLTAIDADVPLIDPVTVSAAVRVWPPEVLRVYALENVWVPLSPPTKV